MQTPVPYVPPSKGLLRTLQAEVQALAHERLAQQLRWYQKHHGLTDETLAQQMNACASVVGIRARTDDAVHAPISEAKIARFKDGLTRPQRQTLEQMTAFFAETLGAKPFLYWADMDDVLTSYHDARRFRKERMPKDLIALTKGWISCDVPQQNCWLALQISPLLSAPVILVRGRLLTFHKPTTEITEIFPQEKDDAFVYGYGTLTATNLNLYVRDEKGRQVIVYMDIELCPEERLQAFGPYLSVLHSSVCLPPEFGGNEGPMTATPGFRSMGLDGFIMNDRNLDDASFTQTIADFIFAFDAKLRPARPRPKTKF